VARIFWFRRDRRLQDNLALNSAIELAKKDGDKTVIPVYWYNKKDFQALSGIRQHSLIESLRSLDSSMNSSLTILESADMAGLASFAKKQNVHFIHATESFDPEGIAEQRSLRAKLKPLGIELVLEDSYYAVKPGTVVKPTDGSAYRVYTPFYKAWFALGWPAPKKLPKDFLWAAKEKSSSLPVATKDAPFPVKAGEQFALETFKRFRKRAILNYSEDRNRADLSGTSHLSHALAHGEIHPGGKVGPGLNT
jgi:deoxyribodipyrimidine photo-lyase